MTATARTAPVPASSFQREDKTNKTAAVSRLTIPKWSMPRVTWVIPK